MVWIKLKWDGVKERQNSSSWKKIIISANSSTVTIALMTHLFQVVLNPHVTESDGSKIADGLMKQLNIDHGDLITSAYIDLLSVQQK